MAYTYRIGIERLTGRVALGRAACAQLEAPAQIEACYASQLPYRAVLYNPRTQRYRLAAVSRRRGAEIVVHHGPFIGGKGVWKRPKWISALARRLAVGLNAL